MVKTVPTRAKRAIKDAAQRGLEGARSVAGGALDAATAAADVVVETTASALDAGRAGIKRSTPAVKRVVARAAKTVRKPLRKKSTGKRKTGKRKTSRRKSNARRRSRT